MQLEHLPAEPAGGEPLQAQPVPRRRLVLDQRGGRVHPEPRLGRTRRRPAAQPGQLLAHQVAAAGVGGRRLPVALGPGEHVGRVAAVVGVDGAVVHLPGGGADRVEEPPVVRDHDQAAPAAAGRVRCRASQSTVSTSRWLVGSSSSTSPRPVGGVQQQRRQCRTPALATRQRADHAVEADAAEQRVRRRRGWRARPPTRGRAAPPARRRARCRGVEVVALAEVRRPSTSRRRTTRPSSGASRPASVCSRVVLPAPLRPTTPTRSPTATPRLTRRAGCGCRATG